MKLPKEQRKIARRAKLQGWEVRRTRNDHTVWISPDGDRVYTSLTPSCKRSMKNHMSYLKRAGYEE